jgi:hypothetical protein
VGAWCWLRDLGRRHAHRGGHHLLVCSSRPIVRVNLMCPSLSVFRHLCGARAQRRESSNLEYATLAHIVRAGGWRTVLLVRYSAIPTHRTCCVIPTFADPEHTCSVDSSFRGMRPWALAVSLCVGAVASETALQVVHRIRARASRHQCAIFAFTKSTH